MAQRELERVSQGVRAVDEGSALRLAPGGLDLPDQRGGRRALAAEGVHHGEAGRGKARELDGRCIEERRLEAALAADLEQPAQQGKETEFKLILPRDLRVRVAVNR